MSAQPKGEPTKGDSKLWDCEKFHKSYFTIHRKERWNQEQKPSPMGRGASYVPFVLGVSPSQEAANTTDLGNAAGFHTSLRVFLVEAR